MNKATIKLSWVKTCFTFEDDENVHILLAPNGCGKTLLGKALAGEIITNKVKHTFKDKVCYINCLTDCLVPNKQIKEVLKQHFKYKHCFKECFESDGIKRLSFIIDKVLNTSDFLYIDLPETNLHVSLQECLIDFIKEVISKDRKVFIATHSPSIIDSYYDLICERDVKLLKEVN